LGPATGAHAVAKVIKMNMIRSITGSPVASGARDGGMGNLFFGFMNDAIRSICPRIPEVPGFRKFRDSAD
jgi:hypothetical protein